MSGLKLITRMSLILVLITVIVAISENEGAEGSDEYEKFYDGYLPLDRRVQYLIETKRSVAGIKSLIDDLHSKLQKRTTCILDGGLSASCNHKDAVEAGQHHRFLASSFSPGRRKRNLN